MQASAFDDDPTAAEMIQAYEAHIIALERLFRRRALELNLDFEKGLFAQRTTSEKRAYLRIH